MVDGSMSNMNRGGGCVIHRRSNEGGNGGRKKGAAAAAAGGVCAICLRERLESLYLSSLVNHYNNEEEAAAAGGGGGGEEEEAVSPNGHHYYYQTYNHYYNPSPPPPAAAFQPPPPPFPAAHSLLSPSPIFDDRLPSSSAALPRRRPSHPFAFPPRRSFTATSSGGASPLRHLRHFLLFPPPPPPASDDPRRLRPPIPPDPARRSTYLDGSPGPLRHRSAAPHSSAAPIHHDLHASAPERSSNDPDPCSTADSCRRKRTADHHPWNHRREHGSSVAASGTPPSSYAFINYSKNHSNRRNSTYVNWIASLFHRKKHDRSRPQMSKADRFMHNLPAFILPSTASVDSSSGCSMLPARASVDSAMPYRRSCTIADPIASSTFPHKCDDHRNAAVAMFRKYDNDNSASAEDISDARVMVSSMRTSKQKSAKQNSKHKMQIWQTSPMFDDDSIFVADLDHQQRGGDNYCRRSVGGDRVDGGYGASPNWAASPAADLERLQRSRSSSAQMQRVVPEPEHFVKMHGRFDSWIATPFRLIVSRRQQQGSGKHL